MQDKKPFLTGLLKQIEEKNPRFSCSAESFRILKKIHDTPDLSLASLTDDEFNHLSKSTSVAMDSFKTEFSTPFQAELTRRFDVLYAQNPPQKLCCVLT